ncbi:IDEAL domain protein [Staphylococcus felis]|uniref:IDEAL domain-containing protein n=1 Tax=Staphylococcus felis TaxID=46127 RepID=UPI000E25EAE9|nr:IDEAL domain-containing protein [Staphylococcus felis]REH90040.1 IDEAL domain protein [Staphylococcus felis]
MKHQTNLKSTLPTNPMQIVNQLGAEMIIEEALKNQRKLELETLIDQALMNKNEQAFQMYTDEYLKLEAQDVD